MMTDQAQMEMPKYQSHKKVWALKIADLRTTGSPDQESDGSLLMVPEETNYSPFKLDAEFVRKHDPKVGGYFVVYEGGYKSFSPAAPFEDGYSLII